VALNPLYLNVNSGVTGRPFTATISGQSAGSTVEVVGYDGTPGFSTVNGRVYFDALPARNPVTVVLRETLAGQGARDSRIDIAVDGIPLGTAGLPAALAGIGAGPTQATRLLRAAARGITSITSVMSAPPTYAQGAANANSTIITASTTSLGGGRYDGLDPRIEHVGGVFGPSTVGNTGYQGITSTSAAATSNLTAKLGRLGAGIRFATDAPAFDIAMNTFGTPVCLYVTDVATGVRQRAAANDQATTNAGSSCYHKWDFGSAASRIVELYFDPSALFRSLNVAATYSIWRAPKADEPRVLMLWDSWGDHVVTSGTNLTKLALLDFIGERLGLANILNSSRGGTGFCNPNAGNYGTYLQRIAAGDIDQSRVGALDVLIMPGSLNDKNYSDAQVFAAVTATIAAARAAQPSAVFILWGPEITVSSPGVQSRYDTIKAAVLASGDQNAIFIDNSPSGENWLFGNASTGNVSIYVDGVDHLVDTGKQPLGYRIADSIIAAVKAKYGI
jgi:hypothetical protein